MLLSVKVALRKTGGGIAMTDVVEIAKQRLDALEAEIGKLDDFIRMAEALPKF